LREEAGVEVAVGGQARAGAGGAERVGHGGDHADLPGAVEIAPALGHLASVVGLGGLQRKLLGDALHDLRRWDHVVHAPAVGGAHVHELDEAHDVAGAAEMARHVHDVVVVHAALDHHVHLDGCQARGGRGVDAFEHLGHRKIRVVHRAESGIVEGIEADGDAIEPRVLQGPRVRLQCGPVGGEREVHVGQGFPQHGDEAVDALAQQRLTTREADLLRAQPVEDARHAHHLLEAEELRVGQEAVVRVEHFPRHAIGAAEIAAVRHRDAQVVQRAAAHVHGHRARGGACARGYRHRGAYAHQGDDGFRHGTNSIVIR
jgi:hypothetical protein